MSLLGDAQACVKTSSKMEMVTWQVFNNSQQMRGSAIDAFDNQKGHAVTIGLTNLFVLEMGPLLTALLLCGRIGGSYAGKVGTMQATAQNKLLQTLGIAPRWWTLGPSLVAAIVAAPLLTMIGTSLAVGLGGIIGPLYYGIGSAEQFRTDALDSVFPVLRLFSFKALWDYDDSDDTVTAPILTRLLEQRQRVGLLDWRVTYKSNPSWMDTVIEVGTYPPVYLLLKATTFTWIILGVAEVIARMQPNLTPRGVPAVITFSVVLSGLLVILADWGFSQFWLMRH